MSEIILNENQRKMFEEITNEQTKFNKFVLKGYAGTGKTITLSEVIKKSKFKSILIVAPTVKALSVLQGKMPNKVNGKKIQFSTLSKLIELPSEQIEVLEQAFKLNEDELFGQNGLKSLLQRLNIWDEDIITVRTIYKKSGNEIKYIINEELLDSNLKNRFNGQSMMKSVSPVYEYKESIDISNELENYDLVIIDEMSMVNEDDIEQIETAMKNLTKNHVKLAMSGDGGQLPPVEGVLNRFFDLQSDENDCFLVELTEILRSTDEISKVAQMIRKGIDIKQLAETIPNGQVVSTSAEQFCKDNVELLKSIDIALAFTNYDVDIFNKHIRAAKGFSGKGANLNEQMIVLENSVPNSSGIVPFANGEEFIITKKYSQEDALEKVTSIFKTELTDQSLKSLNEELQIYISAGVVEMIDVVDVLGNTKTAFIPVNFETQYGYNWKNMKEAFRNFASLNDGELPLLHVNYSYARTIHKSQGSEWNNVLLWLTGKNMWVMSNQDVTNKRKLPYTGYTRAKSTCHLIYSN